MVHTIDVTNDQVYLDLKKLGEKNKARSLRVFVNEQLALLVEKDKFLSKYAPFLSKAGIHENVLMLKDEKLKTIIHIYFKDGKFWCENHESGNCIHVQFALALPECSKLAVKKTD